MQLLDKLEQKLVWLSPGLKNCRTIIKWKQKYYKKQYEILPGEKYAGRVLLDADQGNHLIKQLISVGRGYCVGKLGDVELFSTLDYMIKKSLGKLNKWRLKNNAGFFTEAEATEEYMKFCALYIDAVQSMDVVGAWFNPGEDYVIEKSASKAAVAKLRCLEPYFYSEPWSTALAGKKVLVISPFTETIVEQYKKREHLFEDTNVLPSFELKTLTAVQTIGELKDERFFSWFDALEYMKREVEQIDFDIALVGCGAYSLPLASYIKSLGRGAIHTGGTTQIMFGIKGKRWDENSDINRFYNDYWIKPHTNHDQQKATTATADYW